MLNNNILTSPRIRSTSFEPRHRWQPHNICWPLQRSHCESGLRVFPNVQGRRLQGRSSYDARPSQRRPGEGYGSICGKSTLEEMLWDCEDLERDILWDYEDLERDMLWDCVELERDMLWDCVELERDMLWDCVDLEWDTVWDCGKSTLDLPPSL